MCCKRLAGNTERKKSPSGHHCTTLSGWIFTTKPCIDNQKKLVKQQYVLHVSPQYGELPPTSGWDRFRSLGHPSKFQRLSRLGSITACHSGSGRQPNFAALNRGRHLYSAGRPSRWALAHILVASVVNSVWVWDFMNSIISYLLTVSDRVQCVQLYVSHRDDNYLVRTYVCHRQTYF